MDSGNSESLQSSSDDHESSSTGAAADHSSFFLPPFSSSALYGGPTTLYSSSSAATYLNFVNNLISDENILNQTHILPPPPSPQPPPPQPPSSSSRNPRKRLRVSRRAPTTVLTTDTSNFRAMVQEFTGIPASPFSSTTRRFDIFRSPSSDHPLTFNPFRPIPQKPHHHQLLIPSSSSSLLDQYNNQTSISTNFQTLPDLPISQSHQVSTFQSLLSHQHHPHRHNQALFSLHDLGSMNLGALQQHQNHNPTADDEHQLMMMRQLSEFDSRMEKGQDSSSSAPIKDSSSTTTTTTAVDPWISPTHFNN